MADVQDVAAAIVKHFGTIDTFKLQKLVYYSQAWHLVWDEEPLFPDRIEAWAAGPVVRALYDEHRGRYSVTEWPRGNPDDLSRSELATIELVLGSYGHMSGAKLSQLTHEEDPWKNARGSLGPRERGSREITQGAMYAYYSSLAEDDTATPVSELSD